MNVRERVVHYKSMVHCEKIYTELHWSELLLLQVREIELSLQLTNFATHFSDHLWQYLALPSIVFHNCL